MDQRLTYEIWNAEPTTVGVGAGLFVPLASDQYLKGNATQGIQTPRVVGVRLLTNEDNLSPLYPDLGNLSRLLFNICDASGAVVLDGIPAQMLARSGATNNRDRWQYVSMNGVDQRASTVVNSAAKGWLLQLQYLLEW